MPNTSVHFPKGMLDELQEAAQEKGVTRNRLIIQACRQLLDRRHGGWPPGFFDDEHLTDDELRDLREEEDAFLDAITAARSSRSRSPL